MSMGRYKDDLDHFFQILKEKKLKNQLIYWFTANLETFQSLPALFSGLNTEMVIHIIPVPINIAA